MAPPRLTLSHNRLCGRLRTSAGRANCAPDPIRRALTRLEGLAKGNLVGVRAVDTTNAERPEATSTWPNAHYVAPA
jgi:hypothetical protein